VYNSEEGSILFDVYVEKGYCGVKKMMKERFSDERVTCVILFVVNIIYN
jgi:hypothetical protein